MNKNTYSLTKYPLLHQKSEALDYQSIQLQTQFLINRNAIFKYAWIFFVRISKYIGRQIFPASLDGV